MNRVDGALARQVEWVEGRKERKARKTCVTENKGDLAISL